MKVSIVLFLFILKTISKRRKVFGPHLWQFWFNTYGPGQEYSDHVLWRQWHCHDDGLAHLCVIQGRGITSSTRASSCSAGFSSIIFRISSSIEPCSCTITSRRLCSNCSWQQWSLNISSYCWGNFKTNLAWRLTMKSLALTYAAQSPFKVQGALRGGGVFLGPHVGHPSVSQ